MSSRTRLSFDVTRNSEGETITITIADPKNLQADNLALATWGSSVVLANALHRFQSNFQAIGAISDTQPVVELGAGTGLVGLSAAAVWHTSVVLTDLAPLLSNIASNIELNQSELARNRGSATCGILDWAKPDELRIDAAGAHAAAPLPSQDALLKARVLLAADTVYSEEHPALLVNVIKSRLEHSSASRVVLCYPLRVGYLDHIRDLWQRLEEAGLECVEEGRESIDESWEEDTPYEWCIWQWKSA